MSKNILQLNYDELGTIAKKFKDEGEDAFKLYTSTRQRVRDLHKEWIGDAAEKFFDEMENELLPALQRVSKALHLTQDVTNDIMRIVHDADEDTTHFFTGDFSRDDFGASIFQGALGGRPGGQTGPDDFGAGKFGDALNGQSGDNSGGGSSGPGEASPQHGGGDNSGGGGSSESKNKAGEEPVQTDTATGGGGGGGSSSSSQGVKGDLKNMGIGTGQVQQSAASGSPNQGGNMADHIYSSGGSSSEGSGQSQGSTSGPSTKGSEQPPSEGGGQVAAGAAGAAAAGGAAKGLKGKKKKNN